VGVDVTSLSAGGRFATRFFVDALLPVLLLVVASLLTRQPPREHVDQFFGKMKTPVGATPAEEEQAMAETRRAPHRFDERKLWPGSSWGLPKWDREDTVGFLAACAFTGVVIAVFWGLLRWAVG